MLTKESLQELMRSRLGDTPLIVVSNREPYEHRYMQRGKIRWSRAHGGLVSALDPVLQASGGLWIAHGSGDADAAAVDLNTCVAVPPDQPRYTLKRIWLSKEEQDDFYYGYSNGALWPLCHIVYTRPKFARKEWKAYQDVNRRFADAVLEELARRGLSRAFVFIQDFHLTLVAKYLKEKNPNLVTAHFWHIPWPNPEVFRLCPQRKEILEGLLSNDLLGFHIQNHCNNFMDTVADTLEARIDRERQAVYFGGTGTLVRPFPISIDFAYTQEAADSAAAREAMAKIADLVGNPDTCLAVGVDRIDYTKGIPERLQAIDLFLERYPQYQGKFVYLGVGVLSRIHMETYKNLNDDITRLVENINWKYKKQDWQPIHFHRLNLDYPTTMGYYRAADIGLVSSLHDGMNLVAKEFVAAQLEKKGALVLSRFTGSARELTDALLFNPFDVEDFAEVLHQAVEMSGDEKARRLEKMQSVLREHNIYQWLADIMTQLKAYSETTPAPF
jgi:trehalose 6-phosphate synthase